MMCIAMLCCAVSCKKGNDSSSTEPVATTLKIEASAVTNINNDVLLKLVNDTRLAGCKFGATTMPPVPVLSWNINLASAAVYHSKYLESIKDLKHENANGAGVGDRVTAAGYTWKFVAENIAEGQTTEAQVFDAWLKSEGHCKNMMSANVKEMGAARSGVYWTQVFASK